MNQLAVPNQTQPEQRPMGPAPTTPPPSIIERELHSRIESLTARGVQIQTRLVEIEVQTRARTPSLDILRTMKSFVGLRNTVFPQVIQTVPAGMEDTKDELVALKVEALDIVQGIRVSGTRLLFAQLIPVMVASGKIETFEDVMDRYGSHMTTPEDQAIAKRSLDAALLLRSRFEASAGHSPEDFIRALGERQNITVYGLMTLASTPDLLGFVQGLREASLPEGADLVDMRSILGDANIPLEESLALIQHAEDFSLVVRQELDTLQTRAAMWEADIINAIDNGTFAQQISQFKAGISFWNNPGLYIGLPMDWMQKNYWQPIAGFATREILSPRGRNIGNLGGLLPRPPAIPGMAKFFGLRPEDYVAFEGVMAEAKASGDNTWLAYGKAFDEQDTNWISKMIVEMLFDPTTYLGFGVAKIFKPIPILYPAVRILEQGWIRISDLPFVALQKGIGFLIPKMARHIVDRDAVLHVQAAFDYLNISSPRAVPAAQMGMARISENMRLGLDTLQKYPHHSGVMPDAVRGLLERPILHPDDAALMASSVGKTISPADLHAVTTDLDNILSNSRALPGGMSHAPEESVSLILARLGADSTEDNIRAISGVIRTHRQQALTGFDSIIGQGTFKDFINAVINHRRFILTANQRNPTSDYRSRMAMLMASMSSNNMLRPAVNGMASTFDLANRFSHSFTRMYLMSTFYGPFNVLETAIKSAIMSINPFFRGKPMLQLQRNMMGFESLTPKMFLVGDTFTPQAQDIASAGALARGRVTGSRNAFRRIWSTKQNVLGKLYGTADEAFIQSGARIGLEQAAHVLNSLIQRHLFENRATGPIVKRLTDMTGGRAAGLRNHMAPDILEMHKQEMLRLAIQDPQALDRMAVDFVPGFAHAARIQQMLGRYTTLDPNVREYLVDMAISGDIFRLLRSGDLDTTITESIWQQIFAEPAVYMARIRELTRAVVDIPPDTLPQLQVQTRMLEELNSTTTHIVEQQMSATQAYTRDMLNLDKKDDLWKKQWAEVIQPIMAAGEDSANQIAEVLLRGLREKGYDLPRQAITQYEDLVNKQLVRIRLVTKARESINEFTAFMIDDRNTRLIPSIRRAGGRPNSDNLEIQDWWARLNSGRDRIWREAQTEIAESIADASAVAGALDAFPMPQAMDVSGRPLVMADIAYIYGASPDAVTQGLYLADLKMMRPKEEWVNLVYSQARRVANQTSASPESVGFTKERLATIYDLHLDSVRIRPEVKNLSAPRFVEWDALHKELQSYSQASSLILKPSATDALDVAAKGLLRDIGDDPLTREVLDVMPPEMLVPGRKRTVDELVEAGGGVQIDPNRLPDPLNTFADRSPENLRRVTERGVEQAVREAEQLRRVPGKIRAVREDLDEFSMSEVEFLEDNFDVVLSELDSPAAWDALEARVRSEVEESVSFIRRMEDRVAQIDELVDVSTSEAIERGVAEVGATVPPEPSSAVIGGPWYNKRKGAFQDAIDEYNINFPVYDKNNAFNAGAKFIFPFWTYEAHRWSYLPRVMLRNPGLTHAWGIYNDTTDRGYAPIPGTSLQINPLRNTIAMGGFQRWVNRDFPEFYDQYPDLANIIDQMGRVGFFPNVYVSGAMATPKFNRAGIWQTGEIVPPPIGTVIEALVAIDPGNPVADALAEIFLPNRFRDYRISIRLAMNLPDGQGERAGEILHKRLRGEDLTPEEKSLWDAAERPASLDSIYDYQVGLFRLRPEEKVAAQALAKQVILSFVPISSEQYDEAHKLGFPIESYHPYPIELNDELRSIEEIARWRGLTSHLGESFVGQMLLKQRDYWQRVEDRRTDIQTQEDELDQRFRMTGEGHINRREWERLKSELNMQMSRFIEDLKVSKEFADIPIEYDDRVAFAREHNTLAPIQHPIEEMVSYYFDKKPEDFRFFDAEVGSMVTDWSGFFRWRSTIEDSLEGQNQETFLTRIHRWDTDLDRFRRADYETFIQPWRALWGLTLADYTEGEQILIRQFYATDSVTVQSEIRGVDSGGLGLVSKFQSQLSEVRRRLRQLDPEIDARLAFWGETSSVIGPRAQAIHDDLYRTYGIQVREVVPIEAPMPITP